MKFKKRMISVVTTTEQYLKKMQINANDSFPKEEAIELANQNVISIYKGRVKFTEEKDFTGYEIAEKLHTIESVFREKFKKALESEEG